MYAIQYASNKTYAIYSTERESLIIYATPSVYYLGRTSKIEEVVGRWSNSRYRPKDAHLRLNTIPFLWDASSSTSSTPTTDRQRTHKMGDTNDILTALRPLGLSTIADLYDAVAHQCQPGNLQSTFTARELRLTYPRPVFPELGHSLGTLLSPESNSPKGTYEASNPPTRRGGRLPGRGGAQKLARRTAEEAEEIEDMQE